MESHTTARIIVLAGGGARERVLGERLTIGRSVEGEEYAADELALEEYSASRSHAEIRRIAPGRYEICDLGSLNGTLVNGQRIAQPRALFHGDEICVGKARLRFECPSCLRIAAEGEDPLRMREAPPREPGAQRSLRSAEPAVALVASVHSYGSLLEKLPRREWIEFMEAWRASAGRCVRSHAGELADEALSQGAALAAFWPVSGRPGDAVERALDVARELRVCAREADERFRERFERGFFEVGIGLALRSAGGLDPVQVGLELAELCKEKGCSVLVSAAVAECVAWPSPSPLSALGAHSLREGGEVEVLALVTWD